MGTDKDRKACFVYVRAFTVRKRPYPDNELSNFTRIGAVTTEHSGVFSPPMSLSFCKVKIRYSQSTLYLYIYVYMIIYSFDFEINRAFGW